MGQKMLSLILLLRRTSSAKDVKLFVLRHEVGVLGRTNPIPLLNRADRGIFAPSSAAAPQHCAVIASAAAANAAASSLVDAGAMTPPIDRHTASRPVIWERGWRRFRDARARPPADHPGPHRRPDGRSTARCETGQSVRKW